MSNRFCSTCGLPNLPFARFCQACGSRLPGASGVACSRCGRPALPGDRFCDECGAALAAQTVLILDDTGWRIPIPDRPEVVIGREDPFSGAQPDIDLGPHGAESKGVSRSHARLLHVGDVCRLEDLGSINFTYVNDQRLELGRPVHLKDGDRLSIGNLRIIFRQVHDKRQL